MGFVRSFRLLAYEIEIVTDSEAVARRLDYLIHDVPQPGAVTTRHHYRVESREDGFSITEDGRPLGAEPDADAVLAHLYWQVHKTADSQFTNAVAIHAGTGTVNGRRFLAAGPKFAGKSTLMTRLIYHGARVEGDEMAVLTDGVVTAYPRRFHLREDSLTYLPELAALVPDLPTARGGVGERVYSLDPGIAGVEWRIERGPVGAIYFLDRGHDGATRIVPCGKVEMCRRLIPQCVAKGMAGGGLVAQVAAMVEMADCFVLINENPEQAAAALVRCLARS